VVGVAVDVDAGMAAAVWAEAALAVCPINRLIAFESSGGMGVGVAKAGTRPTLKVRMMDQVIPLNSNALPRFIWRSMIFCIIL
jgi:hypothetical protein